MRKCLALMPLLACMVVLSAPVSAGFSGLAHGHFDSKPSLFKVDKVLVQFSGGQKRGDFRIDPRSSPVAGSIAQPPRAGYGAARDIGAGAAVQTARRSTAGEVLGVRRTGSVYSVKVLDRGRVRIVTIDAYSGNVLNVK